MAGRAAEPSISSKASLNESAGNTTGEAFDLADGQHIALEQRGRLAGHRRQEVGLGIERVRCRADGRELFQPIRKRALGDDGHRGARPVHVSFADREVQLIDIGRELLLERVGDDLGNLRRVCFRR